MKSAEYAAHRKLAGLAGGSVQAVKFALNDGRIHADPKTGLIDPEVADREWVTNTNPISSAQGLKNGGVRYGGGKTSALPPNLTLPDDRPRDKTGNPVHQVAADFAASRTNKEFYESELARLKFEEKEGILVPASVVKKTLFEAARIIRAGHESIVAQLAPDLASEVMISKVEILLKTALDHLDNELADTIAEFRASGEETAEAA